MQILASTPRVVKTLIWLTVAISVLSPPLSFFLMRYYQMSGPDLWLPLSLSGIEAGWFWQMVSYLFINSTQLSLSLGLIVNLFFQVVILWFVGSEITRRYGAPAFAVLYLASGLVAGMGAALYIYLASSPAILFGSTPAIFALLMAWALNFSSIRLAFFTAPMPGKKIAFIIFAISIVIHLARLEWANIIAELLAIAFGFAAAKWLLKENVKPKMNNGTRIRFPGQSEPLPNRPKSADVEVESFREESDEIFMDRMLDKVSRFGRDALSDSEKSRLDRIVRKR